MFSAHDYGCVHPGMPLGRNQFRRSRDAPIRGPAATAALTQRDANVRARFAAVSKICSKTSTAPPRKLTSLDALRRRLAQPGFAIHQNRMCPEIECRASQ